MTSIAPKLDSENNSIELKEVEGLSLSRLLYRLNFLKSFIKKGFTKTS